jgi:tetratricopeptide (TPR) repeat protein
LMKVPFILIMLAVSIYSAANAEENTSAYWTGQGDDLYAQYKFDDALQAYDEALKINGSYIAALVGRGDALVRTGRYNESLQSYDNAIELDQNHVRAWVGRGIALQSLGDFNGSNQAYDRAIEIDPSYARAWNDKAWLYYKHDMYQEAVDYSDKAINLYNRDLAAVLDTKGVALAKLGRNDEALQYIDKALELTPLDSIVWIHRGDILKALGNQAGSEEAYAKAKELPSQALDETSV